MSNARKKYPFPRLESGKYAVPGEVLDEVEKEVEALRAKNERLRGALQKIVDATPADTPKAWPHHHFYLATARAALERGDE